MQSAPKQVSRPVKKQVVTHLQPLPKIQVVLVISILKKYDAFSVVVFFICNKVVRQ